MVLAIHVFQNVVKINNGLVKNANVYPDITLSQDNASFAVHMNFLIRNHKNVFLTVEIILSTFLQLEFVNAREDFTEF